MDTGTREGKQPMAGEEILTLDEASGLLKVSTSWLRRSACPRIRFSPKMVRFNRTDLLKWFNSRSTRAA